MDADERADLAASRIAAAIGEPARARMLYCLMDNRARTATELAAIAEVTASTASVHLSRLKAEGLIRVQVQGKHHYYVLEGARVARVLEGLSVLAGGGRQRFVPSTPGSLRFARTCYDHMAGTVGVAIHDRLTALGWIAPAAGAYGVTDAGARGFERLGVDLAGAQAARRRLAYGCLDWSERRMHLGGALGAAILEMALRRRWMVKEAEGRRLGVTQSGRRELGARLGVEI